MKKHPNAVMQWIGGPSKDLGEKEGSGKFAAVGSTGSSRLEGAASQGALRQANRAGGGGGGEEPLTADGVKSAVEEAMSEQSNKVNKNKNGPNQHGV